MFWEVRRGEIDEEDVGEERVSNGWKCVRKKYGRRGEVGECRGCGGGRSLNDETLFCRREAPTLTNFFSLAVLLFI